MRPIETLLLLATLLTFFVLAVSLPRAVRWMRHSAPVALLIAVAQVLVEGSRWQMVPAYAAHGVDELLGVGVRLRSMDRGLDHAEAGRGEHSVEPGRELRGPIADHGDHFRARVHNY